MKTKNVINALSKIVKPTKTIEGNVAFIRGDKRVTVLDQNGNAIAYAMIGDKIVDKGNYAIKNLVSFLERN